jgi:hypothetical protein
MISQISEREERRQGRGKEGERKSGRLKDSN